MSRHNPGRDTQLSRVLVLPLLGARNTAWNANVSFSALSHQLIFWLKVRQEASLNFNFFFPGLHPLWDVATSSRTHPTTAISAVRGASAPVLGHKL